MPVNLNSAFRSSVFLTNIIILKLFKKVKKKQKMLIFYLFWSTKSNRSDFNQKCKNDLLILFVYTPVVFGKPINLKSSVLKNIYI